MKKSFTSIAAALALLTSITAFPASADYELAGVNYTDNGMWEQITEDPITGNAYFNSNSWYPADGFLVITKPSGLPDEVSDLDGVENVFTWEEYSAPSPALKTVINSEQLSGIYADYGEDVKLYYVRVEYHGPMNQICKTLQKQYPSVLGTSKLEYRDTGKCVWNGEFHVGLSQKYNTMFQNMKADEKIPTIRELLPGVMANIDTQKNVYSLWKEKYDLWYADNGNKSLTGAALTDSLKDIATPGAITLHAVEFCKRLYSGNSDDLSSLTPALDISDRTYHYQIVSSWSSKKLGDIDQNGSVNASDASEILIASAKMGTGNDSVFSEETEQYADINGDHKINAKDATIILQYAAARGTGNTMSLRDYSIQLF